MLNKIFNLLDLNSSDVFLDLFAGSSILSVNAKHLFNCSTIINDFDNILPLDLEYALENILSFEGNRKNFTLARTKYFIKRLRRGWLKKVEKYNQILNSTNIVHFDYKEILNKIIKKEFIYNVTKMYVDPPYYDKEGLYIKSFFNSRPSWFT
ncbi:hypothetical protein [Mycoplasma sp. HU2014]|uniref:hypothetical protein n=1 Tax=Mycoplasma sp. HU2014 TaxID=1664275 RepID=UPI000B2C18AD|nr:hypothetical protein [Mycoplasma sp. HU2014]